MRSYLYLATIALAVSPPITAQSNNLGQRQDYSQQSMKMTFYGYPDNCDPTGCYSSPEGNYVAYDCQNPNGQSRGYKAGGDGTWNNPLSIAGELDQCSIIYIPYLRKYGIIDDRCYGCGTAHIDIWVESQCDDDFDNVCKYVFHQDLQQRNYRRHYESESITEFYLRFEGSPRKANLSLSQWVCLRYLLEKDYSFEAAGQY
ncbi:hypothetical protein F4821DRAFT_265706 [Hypoxylon rubiginosum]|uniref:Uncharacterized protein n=1 Tax=Hypoxylon rubiginosum TaxID=110542 RepID=A0ACC0CJN7_9PEZI|nr:hypothetical protein F4821DRAFT_265706 [Hypoxylon rubiginosum]